MKRISTLILLAALLFLGQGCATRKQHAVDRSMLIQENLQLDQALSIVQYELLLAQQENENLRRQLDQSATNGNTSGDGRVPPPLRSTYESPNDLTDTMFDAHDSTLPPPTNQIPQHFQQRPAQPQHVEVPPGGPQWTPQRH